MDGAQRLALRSGARFISGADLDLDFQRGRYLVASAAKSFSDIDTYHTRSSTVYAQLQDNSYSQYPIDAARIISGVGYQSEAAATNLLNNLNPQGSQNSGATAVVNDITTGITDVFGGNEAIRVVFENNADGQNYLFRVGGSHSANEVSGSFFARLISNNGITTFQSDYGDGDSDSTILSQFVLNEWVRVVPNSGTAQASLGWFDLRAGGPSGSGVTIEMCGFQVEEGTAVTSPTDGARTADKMVIPAASHGLNFTEGALFWKGRLAAQSVDWPRVVLLGDGWNDGLQVIQNNGSNDGLSAHIRSGGAASHAMTNLTIAETVVAGFAWRSDGTSRMGVTGVTATNNLNYVPPVAPADLRIGLGGNAGEAANLITERVVGFSTAPTDAEFDNVFAEISA